MITQDEIRGNWNQLVGAVKSKYSQITGDDVAALNGSVQKLAGLIQEKTGHAREEVETFLRNASKSAASGVGRIEEAAMEYSNKASDALRDGYDYARDATRDTYDSASKTMKQNPVESLVVMFGLGIVAGLVAGAAFFRSRD